MIESIQAMSEPTRFAILQMVRKSEMSAGEIARNFKGITRPAVSQHIGVLKKAGLLYERRAGTRRIYSIHHQGFEKVKALLEDFWDPRLEKLKAAAEKEEKSNLRKS